MPGSCVPPLALIVDDTASQRRRARAVIESELGWRVQEASNAQDALRFLADESPAVVLTDLKMPDCDALKLVESIRINHPFVPVVLLTTVGSEQIALKALQRGAASYVPKSDITNELADSLERVVAAAQSSQNRRRLQSFLCRVELEYTLENDPALIPVLVSQIQEQLVPLKVCDQNGLIRIGVALEEALLNAMYHGNLEVNSQLRQEDEARFQRLIDSRRQESPYRDRRLHVDVRLSPDRADFSVTDEGPGFDPASLPDPTDPANLDTVGGRGLLLIRTFMDDVRFNERGNKITLVRRRESCGGSSSTIGNCDAKR